MRFRLNRYPRLKAILKRSIRFFWPGGEGASNGSTSDAAQPSANHGDTLLTRVGGQNAHGIAKSSTTPLPDAGASSVASRFFPNEPQYLRDSYLGLIQSCLSGSLYNDPPLEALGPAEFDPVLREYGRDWPSKAHTMIGSKRLANLRSLVEEVIFNQVPGDLMETGVWRGGACILMRAVLSAYNVTDRRVWVVDSFEGLPAPDTQHYPADDGSVFHTYVDLAVSLDEVKRNFAKYDLLDKQVVFLQGWFRDTLPTAPIERLAVLRLDGDMYESTILPLTSLYDKLSIGGYVIVDDYHVVESSKKAVHDFLATKGISPKIEEIDGVGVFWRKIDN